MIKMIFSWFASSGISAIGEQLNRAYAAKLNAQNDSERIEAETTIAQLEARQAVLVAEQGNWVTRWIRPAFAIPFIVYNAKILVWDKVLSLGTTDPISAEYWQLQMIVFGAYFLTRPFERKRF